MSAGGESETLRASAKARFANELEHPVMSEDHRLLIRACTASPDALTDAVDEWLRVSGVGETDGAGSQLLPLLYRRLVDHDAHPELAAELAVSYRSNWARTQMLVFRARPLLAKMAELGSQPVLLKGGAMMSSAYHDDLGVRPVVDLDVLVEREVVEPAVRWALDHGWQVPKDLGIDEVLLVHHAIDLSYGDDGAADVHWRLLVNSRDPARDLDLFAESRPARLGELDVRVLSPTHQLMHTASHVSPSGIRHVVDALVVIERAGGKVDWDALGDEVIARRIIANTLRTLRLVAQARPDAIDAGLLERLASAKRHWSDYIFHGEDLHSRRDVVRRFAAEISGRSRGTGPRKRARIARAMVVRYTKSSGVGVREVARHFLVRNPGREPAE